MSWGNPRKACLPLPFPALRFLATWPQVPCMENSSSPVAHKKHWVIVHPPPTLNTLAVNQRLWLKSSDLQAPEGSCHTQGISGYSPIVYIWEMTCRFPCDHWARSPCFLGSLFCHCSVTVLKVGTVTVTARMLAIVNTKFRSGLVVPRLSVWYKHIDQWGGDEGATHHAFLYCKCPSFCLV